MNKNSFNFIGKRYKHFTLLKKFKVDSNKRCFKWKCLCDCGKKFNIHNSSLNRISRQKATYSCGCHRIDKSIIGKRFHNWTALKFSHYNNTIQIWKFKCVCGTKKDIELTTVKNGRSKSCGCLHYKDSEFLGQKKGMLTILAKLDKNSKNYFNWLTICDCGNEREYVTSYLSETKNGIRSCGCQKNAGIQKDKGEAGFNKLYDNYWTHAFLRGLDFELTPEQFKKLTKQKCYYSDAEPTQISRSVSKNSEYIYNGIDRLDNKQGYTKNNCVPSTFICNRAKYKLSEEEFHDWLILVTSSKWFKNFKKANK